MPQPIPLATRQTIVTLSNRGLRQSEIVTHTGVSLSSVKSILRRFRASGEEGLKTNYDRCGQQGRRTHETLYRYYRALRVWHPGWGYDKISSHIIDKRGTIKLPHRRTVYRWWRALGLLPVKSRMAKKPTPWAVKPHQVWQIDAKEMMTIANDELHCWLNIVDEYTGAVIDPPVFPPR